MRVLFRASSIALATSPVVVGIAGGQASQPAPAPAKIGYINSAQLLAQAPGRAEAEAQFDREVGVYRQQIQRMDDSLRTLMAAFDRDAPKLDSVTRETRRTSIGQKEVEYQQRARGLDSTMQARQAQLVKPIMERVQTRLDLTDRVLARLKSQGIPAAPPVSGAVPQPAGVTRPKK